MTKNILYANEIATAGKFVEDHKSDIDFMTFLESVRTAPNLMHSDRWSLIYDYLEEHFPESKFSSIVTGLTYYIED